MALNFADIKSATRSFHPSQALEVAAIAQLAVADAIKDQEMWDSRATNFSGGGGVNIATLKDADITGQTDNTALVLSVLQTQGHVFIPQGAKIWVDKLVMPASTTISGPGSILYNFTAQTDDKTITMQSDCRVSGLRFTSKTPESIARNVLYAANCDNPIIDDCLFDGSLYANQSYVGYETWIMLDQRVAGAKIHNNTSRYGKYGMINNDVTESQYTNNRIFNPATCGILNNGGKYNHVLGNRIIGRNKQYSGDIYVGGDSTQGTVTGISFLTQGFLGLRRGCVNNIVQGNYIYGITEEGIGFDTAANSAYNAPENYVLPIATVQSVATSGQNVVITIQETTLQGGVAAPAQWAQGYFGVVMTGNATGWLSKVISSTSSAAANTATLVMNLNAGSPPVSAGDKILLTCGMVGNEIVGNIINQTTSGIVLYGSSWYNRVDANNVRAITTGVEVASIVAGLVPGAQNDGTPAVGAGVQSYSGCCSVTNNTILLDFEDQPSTSTRGTSPTAGPIVVGTWAYTATPAVTAQNPGMVIDNNLMAGNRTTKIGGQYGTQDGGNSSVTGASLRGNRGMGGCDIVINKTANTFVGPNFKNGARQDYLVGGSANNTGLVAAA